jgi:uncharacterized membrane protein HdeD (DUF308 family)
MNQTGHRAVQMVRRYIRDGNPFRENSAGKLGLELPVPSVTLDINQDRRHLKRQGVSMLHTLARNWWALALRGVVAVLFGLLTFILPGITLVTLVLLFGAYALVDGIFNLIGFFRVASHQWALLIEGVVGIIAGIVTFALPAITAIVLLYVIAFWAIFTGMFEIIAGIRLRKAITNEWLLLVMGALSLLFGVLILFAPGAGALAIVLWIGAYALVFGVFLLALALRLRGHRHLIVQPT